MEGTMNRRISYKKMAPAAFEPLMKSEESMKDSPWTPSFWSSSKSGFPRSTAAPSALI